MQANAAGPAGSPADPNVLFHAGSQAVKVRFVMLLSLASAAGALYWGIDLARSYGLAPADGGVLAPLWQRLAFGLFVAALGVGFAAGMWLYGRYYIVELSLVSGGQRVQLRTMTFFGSALHEFDAADVRMGRRHAGQLTVPDLANPGVDKLRVNAPWGAIHLKGRRWPLILDLQGDLQDRARGRSA